MATTTNFGWETPDDTDLVKDGAAAIRTLGGAIDTSLVDLKGGTTGQVLSKASNTDMDFSWVAQDDNNAIQNAIVDAKGDLISATAADTPARLAVGSNGQVLTADSAEAVGMKWATVNTQKSFSLLSTTTLNGASSYTVTGLSGYDQFFIELADFSSSAALFEANIQFNADTANHWSYGGAIYNTSASSGYGYRVSSNNNPDIKIIRGVTSAMAGIFIFGANKTTTKIIQIMGGTNGETSTYGNYTMGRYEGTSAISSIKVAVSSGNFDAGTMRIFGAA